MVQKASKASKGLQRVRTRELRGFEGGGFHSSLGKPSHHELHASPHLVSFQVHLAQIYLTEVHSRSQALSPLFLTVKRFCLKSRTQSRAVAVAMFGTVFVCSRNCRNRKPFGAPSTVTEDRLHFPPRSLTCQKTSSFTTVWCLDVQLLRHGS